jgi:helix-turn-helix protein
MGFIYEERLSDSPYVQTVMQGRTAGNGCTIRPAECSWHMVLVKLNGNVQLVVTGPLTTAGALSYIEGVELLWIKFKIGAFMPHLPTRNLLDKETALPAATSQRFWLKGSAWQFPDYENADTFVNRLIREEVLVCDPVVKAVLQDEPQPVASRTVRHRFLRATGLTQSHIRQVERAQRAETLLQQGVPILDVVYELGYFDQPHLTRSLKQWVGHTPAEIIRLNPPDHCQLIQDDVLTPSYEVNVLTAAR